MSYYAEESEDDFGKDIAMENLEPRIFMIFYDNGNFHSSTNDQDIAWNRARIIGGWIGELHNVHRPQTLEEVVGPEMAQEIEDSLEAGEPRVRRGRLERKSDMPDIDNGESSNS